MNKIPAILVLLGFCFAVSCVATFAQAEEATSEPADIKAAGIGVSGVDKSLAGKSRDNESRTDESNFEARDHDASAPDGLRPGGTLSQHFPAPKIPREVTALKRPVRNYPEQPPTIPHTVRGYQVTKDFNQCLTCHSRTRSPETGAPMVSITHYWDRDNQPLAAVSPRRYFCLQCHVAQHDVEPAVDNRFKGIDAVLQESQQRKTEKAD